MDAQWHDLIPIAEISGITVHTQSVGLGAFAPSISLVPNGYALSYGGGARPQDIGASPDQQFSSLIPLIEQDRYYGLAPYGETFCTGIAEMIQQLRLIEDNVDMAASNERLLLASTGTGGRTAADLNYDPSITRFKNSFLYGQIRAAELHRTYAPLAMAYFNGESDMTYGVSGDAWMEMVRLIRSAGETAAQSILPGRPLPCILLQINTFPQFGGGDPYLALAQLALAGDAYFCLAGPMYCLPFSSSPPHPTALGSKVAGAYVGRAVKRWCYDSVKPQPLVPEQVQHTEDALIIRFPVESGCSLVFDTTPRPDPGGLGFQALDVSGQPIAIGMPTIIGADKVKIPGPIPVGAKICYGFRGDDHHAWGCLRDDQGDRLTFRGVGPPWPMHNWAPIFEMDVT